MSKVLFTAPFRNAGESAKLHPRLSFLGVNFFVFDRKRLIHFDFCGKRLLSAYQKRKNLHLKMTTAGISSFSTRNSFMQQDPVAIVSALRTPIGKFLGDLRGVAAHA